jgi:hypothetical protein
MSAPDRHIKCHVPLPFAYLWFGYFLFHDSFYNNNIRTVVQQQHHGREILFHASWVGTYDIGTVKAKPLVLL